MQSDSWPWKIALTKGQFALVDEVDFLTLGSLSWYAHRSATGFYAARTFVENGVKRNRYLHRVIANPKPGEDVDHINSNGLDCRRSNLRCCTRLENLRNNQKKKPGRSASRFKGVVFHRINSKWQARIAIGGKHQSLGYFHLEEDAARAYNGAAILHFGEFAHLNEVSPLTLDSTGASDTSAPAPGNPSHAPATAESHPGSGHSSPHGSTGAGA